MARLKQEVENNLVRFEAEDLDAGIPMHAHEPGSEFEHATIVVKGRAMLAIHPGFTRVIEAGDKAIFDSTLWHCIVPLEVGTVWINEQRGRTNEDMKTVVDSPHNAPEWVMQAVRRELNVVQ